jgi:ketosteroid isomerase-like protein
MRTRSLPAFLLGAFVLNACIFSVAQKTSATTATILDLEKKWTDAYKQADLNTMNSLLNEDVIVTVEDGKTYSKSGYLTHSVDKTVKVLLAEIGDVRVRVDEDTAVVTGTYHEKGLNKGKPYEYNDRFTDVWKDHGGKWQLIASHFSVPVK